mmetsp:Transcript_55372/g.160482  ORF Transcript_55372/g.160482 Transcript_55372/m.160482 type:complete len:154 (+) Transcript_55372:72-533(+)
MASFASRTRLATLLHQLRLPPTATKAQLKSAYFSQARMLHPDIAGQVSTDAFQALQRRYDEAVRIFGEVDQVPLSAGVQGRGAVDASRGHWGFGQDRTIDRLNLDGRVIKARREPRVAPERAMLEIAVMTTGIFAGLTLFVKMSPETRRDRQR